MKIIKIITENMDEVIPFLNGSTNYVSEDEGLIELIVGWSLAKEMGASILDHKISENKYWTFLPREKRTIFQEHIKEFITLGYSNLIKEIKTKTLNPINYNTPDIFLKSIEKAIRGGTGYLYSDRLYIYTDMLYHIDMGLLDFMSWDIKNNIIEMIKITEINLRDYEDDLQFIDMKYIPYLINAKESNISSHIHQT